MTCCYRPASYKIKWRLLNALIKFLLVIEKDTGLDLSDVRKKLIAIANRWAPKNIKLEIEWSSGHEALSSGIDLGIEAVLNCSTMIFMHCSKEVQLAYDAVHNKYNTVPGDGGVLLWPQDMGDVPEFSDKQIIKALNCLRAKKDLILN